MLNVKCILKNLNHLNKNLKNPACIIIDKKILQKLRSTYLLDRYALLVMISNGQSGSWKNYKIKNNAKI